jgi:uncharacterized OB-fold protein
MSAKFADWTSGEAAIRYQSCAACGRVQYFRRGFCAACGATELAEQRASGEGTVYATSLVCRSATPETRTHVPYNILLVDIAARVTVRFVPFAGRLVPYFERRDE